MANISIVRIAATLAKTRAARAYSADEIAADALALGRVTRDAHRAVLGKKATSSLAVEARAIAERYGAELVEEKDPELFIFGLRFRDGSYSGPMRHIFPVM